MLYTMAVVWHVLSPVLFRILQYLQSGLMQKLNSPILRLKFLEAAFWRWWIGGYFLLSYCMLLIFGEELIWPFLVVCSLECLALG